MTWAVLLLAFLMCFGSSGPLSYSHLVVSVFACCCSWHDVGSTIVGAVSCVLWFRGLSCSHPADSVYLLLQPARCRQRWSRKCSPQGHTHKLEGCRSQLLPAPGIFSGGADGSWLHQCVQHQTGVRLRPLFPCLCEETRRG